MKNDINKNNETIIIDDNDIDIHFNPWKQKIKKYFTLSTKKITYLSLLLAINVTISLVCFLVFAKVAFLGFLRIELSFISYLICYRLVNSFYASILIFIGTWIRFGWIDNDFVGLISLNISDLLALIIYIFFHHIFTKVLKVDKKLHFYMLNILSFILCIISVGLINIILNFAFLLPMYIYFLGYYGSVNDFLKSLHINWFVYALIIFGFNALKYSINFIIYIMINESIEKFISKL
ncbi:hypothetical protein [Spiroplasma turonicum]|uniref:Transmembrane protein n=1 Tax=Spiroplasma turonicum TaxID=216946 RepID=A0A0K1P889_9MOLU|nr:hypothetical protein [Spiroplasma turonicum]AKU80112.1 hypothetical protein STURON_00866 [Spiroplasma turonicum]ALX71112.1 hypothetical protein STURO_v1c08610 [Spiroplasma turonicum]